MKISTSTTIRAAFLALGFLAGCGGEPFEARSSLTLSPEGAAGVSGDPGALTAGAGAHAAGAASSGAAGTAGAAGSPVGTGGAAATGAAGSSSSGSSGSAGAAGGTGVAGASASGGAGAGGAGQAGAGGAGAAGEGGAGAAGASGAAGAGGQIPNTGTPEAISACYSASTMWCTQEVHCGPELTDQEIAQGTQACLARIDATKVCNAALDAAPFKACKDFVKQDKCGSFDSATQQLAPPACLAAF